MALLLSIGSTTAQLHIEAKFAYYSNSTAERQMFKAIADRICHVIEIYLDRKNWLEVLKTLKLNV